MTPRREPFPLMASWSDELLAQLTAAITPRTVVPLSVALLAAVAAGDYATDIDITFTLLYLVPIALGTWVRGRRYGLALSAAAALAGGAVLLRLAQRWPAHQVSLGTIVWNGAGALGIFVSLTLLLDALHRRIVEEQRKRTLAVEQLRHSERLNVIGTLAAGVAHELGTPLTVIAGHVERIDADGVSRERVHRSSQAILAQTSRMSAIISNLLDFGRRGGAGREWVDLAELVERAASLLDSAAKRADCRILVEHPATPVRALVNAREIEQVVANLALNAVQATPGGTVRVATEADETSSGQFACIRVEDDGTGIAPDDLARIFDPFFTTKNVGEGTGLGLSMSYGIVEDHGGTIRVTSRLGSGSAFVVRLPVPSG